MKKKGKLAEKNKRTNKDVLTKRERQHMSECPVCIKTRAEQEKTWLLPSRVRADYETFLDTLLNTTEFARKLFQSSVTLGNWFSVFVGNGN
jgi:hypothetical protein